MATEQELAAAWDAQIRTIQTILAARLPGDTDPRVVSMAATYAAMGVALDDDVRDHADAVVRTFRKAVRRG